MTDDDDIVYYDDDEYEPGEIERVNAAIMQSLDSALNTEDGLPIPPVINWEEEKEQERTDRIARNQRLGFVPQPSRIVHERDDDGLPMPTLEW